MRPSSLSPAAILAANRLPLRVGCVEVACVDLAVDPAVDLAVDFAGVVTR